MKISLLVIRCLDIEVSKNFYELLGLSFTKEKHGNGPSHYSCEHAGCALELYPNKGEPPKDNSRLGFKVSGLESIILPLYAALGKNMRNLILTFLILSIAGCSMLNVSKREILLAEKKWQSAGIQNYNYNLTIATLERDQACSTPRVGIEIEVRDGHLKKFGTCELNAQYAKEFGTIDAVFLTLRNEQSESPPGLEVRFNESYGFPEYIDINYSRWLTDHRVQYHLSDFSEVK